MSLYHVSPGYRISDHLHQKACSMVGKEWGHPPLLLRANNPSAPSPSPPSKSISLCPHSNRKIVFQCQPAARGFLLTFCHVCHVRGNSYSVSIEVHLLQGSQTIRCFSQVHCSPFAAEAFEGCP